MGEREEKQLYNGDSLDPINTRESSVLFKDAVDLNLKNWKEEDSLARIIWDCIFVDREAVISPRTKITIEDAIDRINKLLNPPETEGVKNDK